MDDKGNHKLIKACVPEIDSPISFLVSPDEKCHGKIERARTDKTARILMEDDGFGGENAANAMLADVRKKKKDRHKPKHPIPIGNATLIVNPPTTAPKP